eukprot:808050-Rhodomonas_salina.1
MARMGPNVGHTSRLLAIHLGKGKLLSVGLVGESRGSCCCMLRLDGRGPCSQSTQVQRSSDVGLLEQVVRGQEVVQEHAV